MGIQRNRMNMYKLYKLYVSAGYVGTDKTYLVKAFNTEIDSIATDTAWDNYCSFDGLDHDISSAEDIAEEFEIDIDSALMQRSEQIYSKFIVEYEEYNVSKHGDAKDYNWIDLDDNDIKVYIRDLKINKVLNG